MRSEAGFPRLNPNMQSTFRRIYGKERGKFEQLLRNAAKKPNAGCISADIPGLTIGQSEW